MRSLRIRAAEHGRSMEEETRESCARRAPPENLGEAIHRRFAALGGVDLDCRPARLTAPDATEAEPGKVGTGFPSGSATNKDTDLPTHVRFALATLPALTTADTTRARLLEALLHEALDPAAEAVTEAAE